jgi:hypothetical protein
MVDLRGLGLGLLLLCLAGCGSSSNPSANADSQRSLLHVTGALNLDLTGTSDIQDNCSVVGRGNEFIFELFHPSGNYQARFDVHGFRGSGHYIAAAGAAPPSAAVTVFKYVSPDQRPSWQATSGSVLFTNFDKAQQRTSGTVEATLVSTINNSDAIQLKGDWTCVHTESGATCQTQGL